MPNLGELIIGLNVDTTQLDKTVAKMSMFKKLMLKQVAELNAGMKTIAGSVQTIQEGMGVAADATTGIEKKGISSLEAFDKHLRMTAMALQRFGYLSTTVLTVPLVGFGKASIQAYKDFEFSMAKIVGLVGIAKEEVKSWGDELLLIGPKLGKSPQELADALYFVTSAGFKSAEALNITEQAAKAAAAGLGETKDVANLVTSAMNAYRKSNLTAAATVDILVAAVREGKGEPAEFARSIGSVIPFAAQLGVSFDQVAGSMAAMTLTGSSAANAATYLRNIFMKMIHPAAQSEKALRGMGSSTAELRDILRDTKNGGLIPMLERVKNLTAKFGEQRLGEIFPNIRGLIGVLSLMGQNLEYNKRVMELVKNSSGDMQKAFEAVTDTVQFKFNKATASMRVSLIQFGETAAKVVVPVIEWLSEVFKNFIAWMDKIPPAMQKFVVGALAFAAALGPLSLVTSLFLQGIRGIISILGAFASNAGTAILVITSFGKAFVNVTKVIIARSALVLANTSSMLGGIINFFKNLISKTTAAGSIFSTFLKWMKVGPFLAVVAAIGAVIGVLALLKRHTNEVIEAQKNSNKYMGEELFAMKHIVDRAKAAAEGSNERKDAIRSMNNLYGKYLSNLVDEKTFLNDITRAQKEATSAIIANASLKGYQEQITSVIGDIAKAYDKGLGDIQNKFAKVFKGDQLVDFINDMYKSADDASKHFMEKFGSGANAEPLSNMFMKSMYNKYIVEMNKGLTEGQVSLYEFSNAWYYFWNVKREKSPILENLQKVVDGYQKVLTIAEKAKGLKSQIPGFEVGQEPEEILKVWADMEDKLYILQQIEDQYKAHGVAIDKTQEKLAIYKEAFESLSSVIDPNDKKAGTAMAFLADKIVTLTKLMEVAKKSGKEYDKFLNDTAKDTNKFALGLELIATKIRFEGSAFNASAAYVQLYEERVADLYDLLSKLSKMRAFPMAGMAYVVAAAELKKSLKLLEEYRGKVSSAESDANLKLLQMEADAFGGVAGKVEVVNYQVQALERQLRAMLALRVTNLFPVSDQDIKDKVDQIRNARVELVQWQNEMDMTFLMDMNNVLGTTASKMELVSGTISALRAEMKSLSEQNLAGTDQFKLLGKHLKELTLAQEVTAEITSAFEQMFEGIIDGAENMAETLGNILKNLAKKLMLFVIQKIVVQAYLEPFVDRIVKAIEAARKMQQAMSVMGLVQNFVLPFVGGVRLAKGGIIPEGYPGDTFPALLSSGEMVVPKKKVEAAEKAGRTYREYFDIPMVKSKPEIAKLQGGGIIPAGYPGDTYPALLSSGEAVIPLSKGGDSVLVTLMKQLITVTEKGNDSVLRTLIGVGDTTKTDPILSNMLQAKEESDKAWALSLENDALYSSIYKGIRDASESVPLTDKGFFKIKDILENGKPGLRNNAMISKQVVADLARATAKEQQPLMPSLKIAMRESGIGSWFGPLDKPISASDTTYNPAKVMQSLDAMDVLKLLPYDEWLTRKGRMPSEFADKTKTRSSADLAELDKTWLNMKNLQEYNKYIKSFKVDPGLFEPFRKEVRFIGGRGELGYNSREKERADRLAVDAQSIMRNPTLYNYADSTYKATLQQQNLAQGKQLPMMTGVNMQGFNLFTKGVAEFKRILDRQGKAQISSTLSGSMPTIGVDQTKIHQNALTSKLAEDMASWYDLQLPRPGAMGQFTGMGLSFMQQPPFAGGTMREKVKGEDIHNFLSDIATGISTWGTQLRKPTSEEYLAGREGGLGRAKLLAKSATWGMGDELVGGAIGKIANLAAKWPTTPGLGMDAPEMGYHALNKQHWALHPSELSKNQLTYSTDKISAKPKDLALLYAEATVNRILPAIKNTPLIKPVKSVAETVMRSSGGEASRSVDEVFNALFNQKKLRKWDLNYTGITDDMQNAVGGRDLLSLYLHGKQKGFEPAGDDILKMDFGERYKKLYPDANYFKMTSWIKHGEELSLDNFAGAGFKEPKQKFRLNEIVSFDADNPIGPIDDISGHLGKVIKTLDNQFVLISQDLWKFNPADYQNRWAQYSKEGSFDKLTLQKQSGILNKIGKPFYLVQNNPIAREMVTVPRVSNKSIANSVISSHNVRKATAPQDQVAKIIHPTYPGTLDKYVGTKKFDDILKAIEDGNSFNKWWWTHPTTEGKINAAGTADVLSKSGMLGATAEQQFSKWQVIKNQIGKEPWKAKAVYGKDLLPQYKNTFAGDWGKSGPGFTYQQPKGVLLQPRENIVSADPDVKNIMYTAIHEGMHGITMGDALIPEFHKAMLQSPMYKYEEAATRFKVPPEHNLQKAVEYYREPTEVYARIQEFRKELNLTPGDRVTPEMIVNLLNKGRNQELSVNKDFFYLLKNPKALMDAMNQLPSFLAPAVVGGAGAFSIANQKESPTTGTKQMPMFGGVMTLFTKFFQGQEQLQKKEDYSKYKGMGIGFMKNPEKWRMTEPFTGPKYTTGTVPTPMKIGGYGNLGKSILEKFLGPSTLQKQLFTSAPAKDIAKSLELPVSRVKKTLQGVEEGNKWMENWYTHPATLKRIQYRSGRSTRANKWYSQIAKKTYTAKVPTEQELINPDAFFGMGAPNFGIGGSSWTNLTHASKGKNVWQGLVNPYWYPAAAKGVAIHEGTHTMLKGTKLLGSKTQGMIKKPFFKPTDLEAIKGRNLNTIEKHQTKYLSNPSEIYSRINQIREQTGLTPGKRVSTDWVRKLIKEGESGKYFSNTASGVEPEFFKLIQNAPQFRKVINKLPAIGGIGAGLGLGLNEVKGSPAIGNPEDIMSLNTTLMETVKWYGLASEGAKKFGDTTKATQPTIQTQTTALQNTNKAMEELPKGYDAKSKTFEYKLKESNQLLMSPEEKKRQDVIRTANETMGTTGEYDFGKSGFGEMMLGVGKDIGSSLAQGLLNKMLSGGLGKGQENNQFSELKSIRDLVFGSLLSFGLGAIFGKGGLLSGLFNKGAMGGVVPPGYPHDSYPALLTSGEAIIPKIDFPKFDKYTAERTDSDGGNVRFIIEGDKLVGILEKQNKRTSIY